MDSLVLFYVSAILLGDLHFIFLVNLFDEIRCSFFIERGTWLHSGRLHLEQLIFFAGLITPQLAVVQGHGNGCCLELPGTLIERRGNEIKTSR